VLQVAIFDATNSTESRRQTLVRCMSGLLQRCGSACTLWGATQGQAARLTVGLNAAVPAVQKQRFHGHFQYLFIESICNDQAVLEQNYRYKMMYSPDYARVDSEQVSHLHPSLHLLAAPFGGPVPDAQNRTNHVLHLPLLTVL
jgi:6-phosphofructo-2-kinase